MLLALFAAATAAAAPTLPTGSSPSYLPVPGQPYEVVRAGDRTMPCSELIAELNGLTMQVQATQAQSTQRMLELAQRGMPGMGAGAMVGNTVAGMAASLVPFGGMALSMGQAAAIRSQTERMSDAMNDSVAMTQNLMPAYERLEHLNELYRDRAC